jgi:predicted acetyltransferase
LEVPTHLRALQLGTFEDTELCLKLTAFGVRHPHAAFFKVPAYSFHMIHVSSGATMGSIRLRAGSTRDLELYAGHIGYRVEPAYRGHRYAARSLRLLRPLALRIGLDPLWITCDPDNLASRRSLELAGAEFVEIVDVPEDSVLDHRKYPKKCRYRLAVS